MNLTQSNVGDLVMWPVLSLIFFFVMGSGFRPNFQGQVTFCPPLPLPTFLKSAAAVAPLFTIHFAPEYRQSFVWDTICLVALAVIAGPLAFPTVSVELEKYSLAEKIGRWLASRVDVALKKWTVAGAIAFGLSFVHSFSPFDWLPIPHYFLPQGAEWVWPFAASFLVLATISLLLRTTVFLAISKLLSFLVVPAGVMLMGYAAELGGAMHQSGVPLSLRRRA
jgi:hypothetical protein